MTAQTDWLTALIIVGAGLILGAMFLYMSRRSQKSGGGELEARRDDLIEKLRNQRLDPAEREALEIETADVLRAIDEAGPTEIVPASPFLGSAMKGFAWGVGTFAVIGGLGHMVVTSAAPRTPSSDAPAAMAPAAVAPAVNPGIEDLKAKLAADPRNHELRNDLAQKELERDNLMAVFEETKVVLAEDPDNSRALTLQAIVRAAMGEGDRAKELLEHATKSDATNLDARVALAWVHAQGGRMPEAEQTIAQAIKDFPAEKALLDKVLVDIKKPR